MSRFGTPTRLTEDPATDAALATALRDLRMTHGEAGVVPRLERRLAAALVTPVASRNARKPSWFWGLSLATAVALLAISLAEHSRTHGARDAATQRTAAAQATTALDAGYLGSGPRDMINVGPAAVLYAMHY